MKGVALIVHSQWCQLKVSGISWEQMDGLSGMSSTGILRGKLQVSLKVCVTFFGGYLWFCEVLWDSVVETLGQGGVVAEAPKHFCSHREAERCRAVVALGRVCPWDARELLCSDGQRVCMLETLVWVPVKYVVFLER